MDREREVEWESDGGGGGVEGQQNACMGVHRKEIKGREV